MLRYAVCFVLSAGAWVFFNWPSQDDYARRHAEAAARLAEVGAAPVRQIVSERFHYKTSRSSPGRLEWGWGDADKAAICIRCPLPLHEVAPRVRTLSYVRLKNGQQVIVELRDASGAAILSRQQVMATLQDVVRLTRSELTDETEKRSDKALIVFFGLIVGAMSTLGYAAIRLRDRRWIRRREEAKQAQTRS
jgi:hypothetical protein